MKCRVEKQKVFTAKRVLSGRQKTKRVLITAAAVGTAAGIIGVGAWVASNIHLRPAEERAEMARSKAAVTLTPCQLSDLPAYEPEPNPRLEFYAEGDSPIPAWYNPDEPMAVEWYAPEELEPGEFGFMAGVGESWRQVEEASNEAGSGDSGEFSGEPDQVAEEPRMVITAEPHPPVGVDPGGVDWNLCTTIWGWSGHGAEAWELDLMARVFYLEFWGTSIECSEAGCDAILNLWDTGKYGNTLFEALSYYDPDYGYTYRVYPKVWQTDYDADGLAWCREFCEERFHNGPEWGAVYFQLGGYHDPEWVSPLYELDGVYFSAGSRW